MKNRFGRIFLGLGALAVAGLIAVAIHGFAVSGRDALRQHLSLALGVFLVVLFVHCWIFLYLATLRREVRAAAARHDLGPAVAERGDRQLQGAAPWAAAAVLATLVALALGGARLVDLVPELAHGLAFLAAAGIQGWALVHERRSLRGSDRLLAELERRLAS